MKKESYKQILLKKESEIIHRINQHKDFKATILTTAQNEEEVAQMESQDDLNEKLKDRDIITLKQIKSALKRIEDDEYGICIECDEEISQKRLKALPFTLKCLDCSE